MVGDVAVQRAVWPDPDGSRSLPAAGRRIGRLAVVFVGANPCGSEGDETSVEDDRVAFSYCVEQRLPAGSGGDDIPRAVGYETLYGEGSAVLMEDEWLLEETGFPTLDGEDNPCGGGA